MTNEPIPPGQTRPAGTPVDEWIGRGVAWGNAAIAAACLAIVLAWAMRSTFRGHLIELALLLVPMAVSALLAALPRENQFRMAWCLMAFLVSPAAIAYLSIEASAAYAAHKTAPGNGTSLAYLVWLADLILWMCIPLNLVLIVTARLLRTQRELTDSQARAETELSEAQSRAEMELSHAKDALSQAQNVVLQAEDAFNRMQNSIYERDDFRIVELERAVAAIKRRLSERDGY